MEMKSNVTALTSMKNEPTDKVNLYRFDVFKGVRDESGKVIKLRSVGDAYLREGLKTYTVVLKTFLEDRFYLLPNTKFENESDFVILTREPAKNLNRKYFWNKVGEGKVLDGLNSGVLALSWDLFSGDIYMNLHPVKTTEVSGGSELAAA